MVTEFPDPDQLTIFEAIELSEPINPQDAELGRVIPSRSTDPDTSRAAEPVRIKAGTQRARLLAAFAVHEIGRAIHETPGLTDEQAMLCAEGVAYTSEYAKRCSELREGGFIEPTGETRIGAAGAQRIVSRITDKGRQWIRENR